MPNIKCLWLKLLNIISIKGNTKCVTLFFKNFSGTLVYKFLLAVKGSLLMIFCAVLRNDAFLAKICVFETPFQSDISVRIDLLPMVAQTHNHE